MADDPKPTIAVGGVVVRDDFLLMVKRGKEPNKGLWTIPGGRVKHGEYLEDAVAREVKEETGLDVEVRDLLGILEVVGDPHYVILDHVATCDDRTEPTAGDDAADARWVPLAELDDLECTPRLQETLRAWGAID